MKELIDFLGGFNLQTIISMAVIVWWMKRDITIQLSAIDKDLRKMNTRISRVEGTVYGRKIYETLEDQDD